MQIKNNILQLDIKIQDKFRQTLADVAAGNLKLKCVQLGDSDVDYQNSLNVDNFKILNSPFNSESIRYPLIYDGSGRGLEGYITCFARQIDSDGNVLSLYNYPGDFTFLDGRVPPDLNNGYSFFDLTFDGSKMGYILFFQTILLNYVDENTGFNKALNEKINMKVTFFDSETVPPGWEVVKDESTHVITIDDVNYVVNNNSMMIAKSDSNILGNNADGKIYLTGALSNISKTINFNI